jgi:ABC-2 type transport system permease protein
VQPLLALARADIVRYLSNRRALLVTLAAPILIAAFFGAVLGDPQRKPSRVPIALTDLDASAVSASIVEAISADPAVAVEVVAEPAAIELVRNGRVRAAAVIPPGSARPRPARCCCRVPPSPRSPSTSTRRRRSRCRWSRAC